MKIRKTPTRLGTLRDPDLAFERAVQEGRLSRDKDAANYAGNYMYMHTAPDGTDQFKNIDTRKYDV